MNVQSQVRFAGSSSSGSAHFLPISSQNRSKFGFRIEGKSSILLLFWLLIFIFCLSGVGVGVVNVGRRPARAMSSTRGLLPLALENVMAIIAPSLQVIIFGGSGKRLISQVVSERGDATAS